MVPPSWRELRNRPGTHKRSRVNKVGRSDRRLRRVKCLRCECLGGLCLSSSVRIYLPRILRRAIGECQSTFRTIVSRMHMCRESLFAWSAKSRRNREKPAWEAGYRCWPEALSHGTCGFRDCLVSPDTRRSFTRLRRGHEDADIFRHNFEREREILAAMLCEDGTTRAYSLPRNSSLRPSPMTGDVEFRLFRARAFVSLSITATIYMDPFSRFYVTYLSKFIVLWELRLSQRYLCNILHIVRIFV